MGNELHKLAKTVVVFDFVDYRGYLGAVYAEVKAQVGSYSYLEFAFDMGFSRSNVIRLVISGKRRLTAMTSRRVIESLRLKGREQRYLDLLVKFNNSRNSSQREKYFQEMVEIKKGVVSSSPMEATLEYFSEWYHPVIRELVGMPYFRSDPAWIAIRLYNNLLPRQIAKSLELLERIGLIVWDGEAKRHVQVSNQNTTDRLVDNIAAVRCHQKMIEIARESITRISEQRREIHGLTIRVSEETAAKCKALLTKTCEEILALEASDAAGDQIYQFNLQLFPFTKIVGID